VSLIIANLLLNVPVKKNENRAMLDEVILKK